MPDTRSNPERIVLGGGSAGGHLALLAAYTPDHPQLTPPDVQGEDLSVRAVVSYYGPTDLRACYLHLDLTRTVNLPKVEIGLPGAAEMKKSMTEAGRMDTLLGGHLHQVPEVYDLASPVTHVRRRQPGHLAHPGRAGRDPAGARCPCAVLEAGRMRGAGRQHRLSTDEPRL